ncbi:helix-turn-helix domain-containing protein [Rhodococcus sp. NPDC056506]|uniref:helix-turn-helix domain-containing protein n=1 Tax=Rhodococcus sp. NPDC056506 TaxID=3345844 RepID=UPI0036712B8B
MSTSKPQPVDDEEPPALAAFIEQARVDAGIRSIREAARIAGVSPAAWQQQERGTVKDGVRRWPAPTLDTLERIAEAVGVSKAQIRKVAGNHIAHTKRPATISPVGSRSIDVSGLTDEQIELLQQLADSYKSSKGKRR